MRKMAGSGSIYQVMCERQAIERLDLWVFWAVCNTLPRFLKNWPHEIGLLIQAKEL